MSLFKRLGFDTTARRHFFYMFALIFLLNMNFTLLRSIRNTLTVVDLGKGAHSIPFFEFFGALPAAIFMTWGLTWLLGRFSMLKVFIGVLALFVTFFVTFALGIYPLLLVWKQTATGGLCGWVCQGMSMAFHVMTELWKPALIAILLCGLMNQYLPLEEAKKLYAPFMLGASLGGMTSGPLVTFATSSALWSHFPLAKEIWSHALIFMMGVLFLTSCLSAFLYLGFWRKLKGSSINPPFEAEERKGTLKENLKNSWKSPKIRLLSWIVMADYISYSLWEVVFLDLLKRKFPTPCDYCHFMGLLSFWSGIFTVFCAVFLTPWILQRCRWVVAAAVLPLCLILTQVAFFLFLRIGGMNSREVHLLGIAVFLGGFQYCLCRALKYTFFDSSKELAFVAMPDHDRMGGKLIIDGICARLGRGGASVLSIGATAICGGVLASSFLVGVVAISIGCSWLVSAFRLGNMIDKRKSLDAPQAL